jgi:hypothetical protein
VQVAKRQRPCDLKYWFPHMTSLVTYEGVSKSFRTDHLELELQMVQLFPISCSCVAILWVSVVSFAAMTLCVIDEKPPRNSAGFCGGGQGLSWAVGTRKEEEEDPLCCSSASVYCCKHIFRYRLSPESFGYTVVCVRHLKTSHWTGHWFTPMMITKNVS